MLSRFSFPTTIHFGPGARHQVAEHLKSMNFSSPLLVTDRALAELPVFKDFKTELTKAGLRVSVFSNISGNPVKSQVSEGTQLFTSTKSDSIIGFGGGAALDVAKAIVLMAFHPGDLFDYEDEKPGAKPIDKKIPYWIALPTTSGTGSEVGRSSVISDDKTHAKKIMFSPRLLAAAVFADPEVTLDLPSKITAATGMDALTHCVESYLAKSYHPICDGIALEGLRLVSQNLVKSVKNPRDIEARSSMMMASMMGAIAFQKGLGLTHSCAHALSTIADVHHGLANGVMITHALPFNIQAVPQKFTVMAETVGIKNAKPESFIDWLNQLNAEIQIPKRLSELGIKKDQIENLTEVAINDACHPNNPRPCSRDDFKKIFTEAL